MATTVNFSDAEPLKEWAVVDSVTITGNKINLKLGDTEIFEVSHVIGTVNRNDEFKIVDIDFEEKRIVIEVDK